MSHTRLRRDGPRFGMRDGRFGMSDGRLGMRGGGFGMSRGRLGVRHGRFGMRRARFGMRHGRFGVRHARFGMRRRFRGMRGSFLGMSPHSRPIMSRCDAARQPAHGRCPSVSHYTTRCYRLRNTPVIAPRAPRPWRVQRSQCMDRCHPLPKRP